MYQSYGSYGVTFPRYSVRALTVNMCEVWTLSWSVISFSYYWQSSDESPRNVKFLLNSELTTVSQWFNNHESAASKPVCVVFWCLLCFFLNIYAIYKRPVLVLRFQLKTKLDFKSLITFWHSGASTVVRTLYSWTRAGNKKKPVSMQFFGVA